MNKSNNKRKGDDFMNNASVVIPKLDIDAIFTQGKKISSQEALSDVTPINWSNEVLNGDYQDKTIIKSKE